MPDHRVSLDVLNSEWSDCNMCDLGVRRDASCSRIITGDGEVGGVMFIGTCPNKIENEVGRVFYDEEGETLRSLARHYGIPSYFTNLLLCRGCEQASNSEGELVWNMNRKTGVKTPYIVDRPPTTPQIEACRPRLYEEIYKVDPQIIVALGTDVAKALTQSGRYGGMRSEHGQTTEILVPGAGRIPSLTEKKQAWFRKVHGEYVLPTEQRMVRYLMFPTFHPSEVSNNSHDMRNGSIPDLYVEDIALLGKIIRSLREHSHPQERRPKQEEDTCQEQ